MQAAAIAAVAKVRTDVQRESRIYRFTAVRELQRGESLNERDHIERLRGVRIARVLDVAHPHIASESDSHNVRRVKCAIREINGAASKSDWRFVPSPSATGQVGIECGVMRSAVQPWNIRHGLTVGRIPIRLECRLAGK